MLFFHSLPCNATEYLVSQRTDYCLPPPERRLSINNCPHRSGVGSYNNLRAYRLSSPASTMQNQRFDSRPSKLLVNGAILRQDAASERR